MRNLIFLLIPIYLCCSCGADEQSKVTAPVTTDSTPKSNENHTATNQTDARGYRQGYWIIYGNAFPERGYPADGKIEEGNFRDGERDGEWMLYEKDGMTPAAKLNYEQDMLHDTCRYYNQEKNTQTVIVYDFGQLVSIETSDLKKEEK